ncbi:MAG: MBL fold metallo-hydrolase [Verrucomicrobiae bacterium]|nr:MBL fold metallo-hydrolase [Verrucomicrobiae bacterium]
MPKTNRFEILSFRSPLVTAHGLLDHERHEATLVDGGLFPSKINRIRERLRARGFAFSDVRAILLTHGHLDHTANLACLRKETGAPLYAPEVDRFHIEGRYPYRGLSRICGALESIGRLVLNYETPTIDEWFSPDDQLPFWGGLRVIGLPGHTLGHCGFLSESQRLLVAGDLFSNFRGIPRLPPPWFNVDEAQIRESVRRANKLIPDNGGVLMNHGHEATPESHRAELRKLAERIQRDRAD